MSDRSEKRERRRFEPPPWEQEAFEDLAKKRAEETPVAAAAPPEPVVTAAKAADEPPVPDARIDAMLTSLAAEEPASFRDWTIGAWVSAALGLFGTGIVLYGFVGMTRGVSIAAAESKTGVMMMGLLMAGVGAILLGMAAWVGRRAWKRRGE